MQNIDRNQTLFQTKQGYPGWVSYDSQNIEFLVPEGQTVSQLTPAWACPAHGNVHISKSVLDKMNEMSQIEWGADYIGNVQPVEIQVGDHYILAYPVEGENWFEGK